MRTLTLLLLLMISISGMAQKLPNIQQVSLRAPVNVKIDGKATEWESDFKAYNSGSRVFYTLSNDDTNLFLYLKMEGDRGTAKALYGGVQFSIMSAEKRSRPINITFHAATASAALEEMAFSPTRYKNYLTDTANNKHKMDSLVAAINKLIGKTYKQILVSGITTVKEPLLSVYNDEGILAAAQLNNHMEYFYELAVPLKYLARFIPVGGKLKYNIQINPRPFRKNPGAFEPPVLKTTTTDFESIYMNNATDFNGEYTLAK